VIALAACGSSATPGALSPTTATRSPEPFLTAQARGTIPPQPSPLPTASGTATVTAAERDAWSRVRAMLPAGSPVAMPTWLPSVLDRDRVAVTSLSADAVDPRYLVTYTGGGRSIEFGMGGDGPPSGGSGVGTRVRRSPAALTFPSSLFTEPSQPLARVVKWTESGRTLWISSSSFPGGDLLHVAWSLDDTTAPAPKYVRVKDGACASTSDPQATVDRLMALIGSQDVDAVLDCFALDVGLANWASLPTTTERTSRTLGEIGGRVYVYAGWRFTSEPIGWTQGSSGSQFLMVGLEGGRWRVFEGGTAAYGSPP
jgi:hypothetical protein